MDLSHDELLSFISESCTMSKALDEYEGRKSCAITTARRLAQFLGDERIKDKGLNCNYVIARRPDNLPTSDRAIPVAIFSTEPLVARTYLRKWCGDISGGKPSVRLDYTYLKRLRTGEDLTSAIHQIATIFAIAKPAEMLAFPCIVLSMQGGVQNTSQLSKTVACCVETVADGLRVASRG